MIESRYKIEYVLPDEDVKKSSPFKVLWYLLLIPLIICVVTLITYDFSVQNISRDSLVLVEKAKVYIFNLEDKPKSKNLEKVVNRVLTTKPEENVQKITPTTVTAETSIDNKKLESVNNEDKKIIGELTEKQKLQLKTIQEQVEKNTQLNENLNKLSKQLVLEKIKSESLSSKLSEQEKDRLELEFQLNKALVESEKKEVARVETTELEEQTPTLNDENDSTQKVDTVKAESSTNTNSLEVDKTDETVSIDQSPNNQESNEKSETDKIVEAMSTISASTEKVEEPKTTSIQEDVLTNLISVKSETKNSEKTITQKNEIVKEPEAVIKVSDDDSIAIEKAPIKITEEVAEISTNSESTKSEIKTESIEIQTQEVNSSVDDIIAVMENSETNTTNDSTNLNQKNNDELEEEPKQQVVEQGDVSIDN